MLRRGAKGLLPRLLHSQGVNQAGASVALWNTCISIDDDQEKRNTMVNSPSAQHRVWMSRSFASDTLTPTGTADIGNGVTVSTVDGMLPTVYATKNPSQNITYDTSNHEPFAPGDVNKRAFTYFVLTGGRFIYASAIRLAVLKFILSMTATKDVLAMANLEVDLSSIEPGQTVTVKWRGKPVFIRHRTENDIASANDVDVNTLRDPEPDEARVKNPDWLIVIGVCTHLGCVPLPDAGDYSGWFCPCHGSHYDTSGRIRKGPAPYNLEVPEYNFLEDNKVMIG